MRAVDDPVLTSSLLYLDGISVSARRHRAYAHEVGGMPGLCRRHEVEDHAVGDTASQREHPRS